MKKKYVVLLVICVVAVISGAGFYISQSEKEPPVVETEQPEIMDIMKKTTATGSIVPRKEIEIKSQVSGVVETIYVKAGEAVTKGQLLAKIRIIPDMVNLNNAQSELNTARINFDNAKREKERQEVLFKDNIISDVEYSGFLLEYNLAQERLQSSESKVQLIKEGSSRKSGQTTNLVKATAEANADIVLEKKEQVLAVKESNLIVENDSSFVEVRREAQEFEKILVQTGLSDGENIEILTGLTNDDQIKKL